MSSLNSLIEIRSKPKTVNLNSIKTMIIILHYMTKISLKSHLHQVKAQKSIKCLFFPPHQLKSNKNKKIRRNKKFKVKVNKSWESHFKEKGNSFINKNQDYKNKFLSKMGKYKCSINCLHKISPQALKDMKKQCKMHQW